MVFDAKILLTADDKQFEVMCRASDTIAIAVRIQAPIFVEESVMERAGISNDVRAQAGVDSQRTVEEQGPSGRSLRNRQRQRSKSYVVSR